MPAAPRTQHSGTVGEVFLLFLRLGVTSFGGPVAHLGYFREAVVVRRRWLGDRAYADLVALCQFLPGPASSQVGMAIGLQRAGIGGLLAAWAAFTLPSAVLLVAVAGGVGALGDTLGSGWIAGLKAAAVAVVAHAVLGMARSLAAGRRRATIAVTSMILVLLVPSAFAQLAAIAVAAIAGLLWLRAETPDRTAGGSAESAVADATIAPPGVPARAEAPVPDGDPDGSGDDGGTRAAGIPRAVSLACLAAVPALLLLLPLLAALTHDPSIRLFELFSRAGALVFGGGHVVLPLLQTELVGGGLLAPDTFLAGYGAAQAVPGPLFTVAAFLGSVAAPGGLLGAAIALVAIFLPGALLLIGALPFWERIRRLPRARRALAGVNAGVVGILAAALYTPVFTEGIGSAAALALAAAAFVALSSWRVPAWAVVVVAALAGWLVL